MLLPAEPKRSVVQSNFDRALSRHRLQEGGIESLSEKSLNDLAVVACAECFENEGLRLDATAIGRKDSSVCPRCGATGGTKLTKRSLAGLAQSFFVQGSVHRTSFGAAPLIAFNERRSTSIGACPGWPSGDAVLFEQVLKIGFFWYGPPLWQVGINENLEKMEQKLSASESSPVFSKPIRPRLLRRPTSSIAFDGCPEMGLRLTSSIRQTGTNSTARLFGPRQRSPADSTRPTFLSCTARQISTPVCTNAV